MELKISQFKCFEDATIPFRGLTVFTGANGNGKSTAIQSLLYLRRTIEHCGEWSDATYHLQKTNSLNVPLNGVYCLALGNSSLVLNQNYGGNEISLGLSNENQELTVSYQADNLEARLWLTPTNVTENDSDDFPILLQEFYYLNAERIGPRVYQPMQFSDYPNAGWQGEYTAQLLSLEGGYFKVANERRFPGTESNFLQDQVNFWLDFIIKGVKIKVEPNPKTLTAVILIENQFTIAEPTLSTNLGFGISYILPIIATGLVAKKGSYFVVENPEAHLHPSAQSKIGQFLSVIAAAGVNVIVETHSDHFINGVQIAVAEKRVAHENVAVNFFNTKEGVKQPDISYIDVKPNGELSSWPKGFFDQTQVDYAHLFQLRKG